MQKIAILFDSSAGIKKDEMKENWYKVPLLLNVEDGQAYEDDEASISEELFYEILENKVIKTSQTPPGVLLTKWDELLKTYDLIVCAFISKGISGQYENAVMLSKDEKYQNRVIVIDTDFVAQLLASCVYKIEEYVINGKDIEKLQEYIDEMKKKYTAFIIPKSLSTLKRGGRISLAAAALATILKTTPILSFQGTIDKFDKTRTFKKAVDYALTTLRNKYPKNNKEIWLICSKIDADTLEEIRKIIKKYKYNEIKEYKMPNVIVAHTGANTIAVIAWEEQP